MLIRSGSEHRLGAVLGAGAAALSAGGEARPSGELAVDGASEPVASHGIDERSTCCTTTGGMGENRSTAGLGAHGAAGLGASSPGGNIAVNGATEPVARVDLGEGGGSEIDVGGRGNDGASLGIGANCAAVLGAGVEAGVEAVPAGGLDVERAEVL